MFCRKCGAELNDTTVFCSGCGTKVEITSENKEVESYKSQIKVLKTLCISFLIMFLAVGGYLLLKTNILINKVTLKNYNSIKIGMNYREVSKILGTPRITAKSAANNYVVSYTWTNSDWSKIIIATFDHDKLFMSPQKSGLEN